MLMSISSRRKNARYTMGFIYLGRNNASIRKKEYLRIEEKRQNKTRTRLHKLRSKTNPLRKKSSEDIRPPPRHYVLYVGVVIECGSRIRIYTASPVLRPDICTKDNTFSLNKKPPPLPFTGGHLGLSRFPEMHKARMVLIGPPSLPF